MTLNPPFFNYEAFNEYLIQLVKEHKTSGENQSEALINFTALNQKRMERINKNLLLNDELLALAQNLKQKQIWQVITEAWCGDSAQNLPVLAKIAEASKGNIEMTILLRDKNTELIDKYLTNGGRSIPKLISKDPNGLTLFTWGPRPVSAQALLNEWKTKPEGKTWEQFELELHTWYAKDKTKSTQNELYEMLKKNNIETIGTDHFEFHSN